MVTKKLSDTERSERARRRFLLGLLCIVTIVGAAMWWSNRAVYPPSSSLESEVLVKGLYTACNQRNEKFLRDITRRVEKAFNAKQINADENEAFTAIISEAQRGSWDKAAKASLQFARDQMRR